MTTISLTEARDRLPELIRRMAAGEQVVLTEGDKWVARLAPPPSPPPTAEEIAASVARAEAAIRQLIEIRQRDPVVSPEDLDAEDLIEQGRRG